ncbi:MAG: 1-deoxy-D-xylulose-5-phosphate synthase [Limnochordia bacterium]|jgi:1-deoxy-D-xylulose-5-phosphate synthase|nr:1-deoxy-D-xylulose-5-phosphate synthase [Limnochordia bacterium]MDD4517796.1 1-deoxy-D-xylulose-5-phosphate synthase [Limnochordia bacterium]
MNSILSQIHSPRDLRQLDLDQLNQLAREIRNFLVETVSLTGGHLAANLGVVELTIALHAALDCPKDKIIWDVGHQCYVHKILTGRKDKFGQLRQIDGLSGFPSPKESHYDVFTTGHASTSISAALGLALARDRQGQDHRVVAVIGDGSLTGGLAFEGLNHAGRLNTDLLVILNDNEMSISPNVGALSNYLTRLRMEPTISKARYDLEKILRQIPGLGGPMGKAVDVFKDSIKHLLVPGIFFEELGFTYLGPINGHDFKVLQKATREALSRRGPVLVHVITEKGKGYPPAEDDPARFHGVRPSNGRMPASAQTFSKVFGRTLVELARENPDIVAITAAMKEGTGLGDFASLYPERFYDVGIAEAHAVTLAGGLAKGGLRPVVAVYSTFLQRAYDQIIHDVALQELPVVLVLDRAGIVGQDGPTHHGVFDLSYLRHIPHLQVAVPSCGKELEQMLTLALKQDAPVAIRYPSGQADAVYEPEPVVWGQVEVPRAGQDVAIFAVGVMVELALEAANLLLEQGISAAVVNVRFVKPLSEELFTMAKEFGKVVTVEDNVVAGGFSAGLLEGLAKRQLHPLVKSIGIPDQFVEHGSRDELLARYGVSPQGIKEAALDLVTGRRIKVKQGGAE